MRESGRASAQRRRRPYPYARGGLGLARGPPAWGFAAVAEKAEAFRKGHTRPTRSPALTHDYYIVLVLAPPRDLRRIPRLAKRGGRHTGGTQALITHQVHSSCSVVHSEVEESPPGLCALPDLRFTSEYGMPDGLPSTLRGAHVGRTGGRGP